MWPPISSRAGGQPVSDADATEELLAVDEPELGVGHEAVGSGRLLEALSANRRAEGLERLVVRPGIRTLADVPADDGGVTRRAATFGRELGHRGCEGVADTRVRRYQLGHGEIVA